MEKITSTQNSLIKEISKLKDGKSSHILVEGKKMIYEAKQANLAINRVFLLENVAQYYVNLFNLDQDIMVVVSQNVIKALSDTVTPQDIIAIVEMPPKNFGKPNSNFLVLEGIQDPGNFGTILRTALGAGFNTIYTLNCVNFKNPKVVRASMGAVFNVDVINCNITQISDLVTKNKYQLFCADMNGENIFEINKPQGVFGIVLGSEGSGVSENMTKLCTKTISIPMNKKLESLNVAISASLAMYILSNK